MKILLSLSSVEKGMLFFSAEYEFFFYFFNLLGIYLRY